MFSESFFLNAWQVYLQQRRIQRCFRLWNHDFSPTSGLASATLLLILKATSMVSPVSKILSTFFAIHVTARGKLAVLEQSFSQLNVKIQTYHKHTRLKQVFPSPILRSVSPHLPTLPSLTKTNLQLKPMIPLTISCQLPVIQLQYRLRSIQGDSNTFIP